MHMYIYKEKSAEALLLRHSLEDLNVPNTLKFPANKNKCFVRFVFWDV